MFRQATDLASMMMDVKTLMMTALRQDDLAPMMMDVKTQVMTLASQQEDIENRLKTFETRIENIETHMENILMRLSKGKIVQKYNKRSANVIDITFFPYICMRVGPSNNRQGRLVQFLRLLCEHYTTLNLLFE